MSIAAHIGSAIGTAARTAAAAAVGSDNGDGRIYRKYRYSPQQTTTSTNTLSTTITTMTTTSKTLANDYYYNYLLQLCQRWWSMPNNNAHSSSSSLLDNSEEDDENVYERRLRLNELCRNIMIGSSTSTTSTPTANNITANILTTPSAHVNNNNKYYYYGHSGHASPSSSSFINHYGQSSLSAMAISTASSSSYYPSSSSYSSPSFGAGSSIIGGMENGVTSITTPTMLSTPSAPSTIQQYFSQYNATDGLLLMQADDDDSYLDPNLKITLIVLLSFMIIMTVIGNILVCLSVILVRKLRHPSNYLLVSLAISDLCVAILVMPLALQYELSQSWRLSNAICDLWVSFDVTACTSSILNLCTISIDRYLAITKPLTYGVRRTTKRILSFIVAVWVASCLISIPPVLILGNEHGGSGDQARCEVSQNLGYQLYATLGAFYIPLLVMIIMYYKIYVAAKRVVDAELRDQRPSCSSSISLRTSTSGQLGGKRPPGNKFSMLSNRFYSMRKPTTTAHSQSDCLNDEMDSALQRKIRPIKMDRNQNCLEYVVGDAKSCDPEELQHLNPAGAATPIIVPKQNKHRKSNHKKHKNKKSNSKKSHRKSTTFCCCCCCGGERRPASSQTTEAYQKADAVTPTSTTATTTTMMVINSTADGRLITNTTTSTTTTAATPPQSSAIIHQTQQQQHKHLNGHQKSTPTPTNATPATITTTMATPPTSNHHQHYYYQNSSTPPNSLMMMAKPHPSPQHAIESSTPTSGRRRSYNNNNNQSSPTSSSSPQHHHLAGTSMMTSRQQRASNALRERKASVTLGIIMTAFTVCWLPFFILALLRPFSASVMQIPRYVNSIALWLGYANSMLNPIIYVTFHQDFRRAFKYLLCLQCRSMGKRLRAEAYISQYGQNRSQLQHQQKHHEQQQFSQACLTPATSSAHIIGQHAYQHSPASQHIQMQPIKSSELQTPPPLTPPDEQQQQHKPIIKCNTGSSNNNDTGAASGSSVVHFQLNDQQEEEEEEEEDDDEGVAKNNIEQEECCPLTSNAMTPMTSIMTNTTTTTNASINMTMYNINQQQSPPSVSIAPPPHPTSLSFQPSEASNTNNQSQQMD